MLAKIVTVAILTPTLALALALFGCMPQQVAGLDKGSVDVTPEKIVSYLRMEIMMDTDTRRLMAGTIGRATVRWKMITPHPYLSEDRARIAIAALHYGRILFAHNEEPIRTELFHRVQRVAQKLIDGEPAFDFQSWQLHAGGMSLPIWPWLISNPEKLRNPKIYTATMIRLRTGDLGIILNMALGLERILAPASALLPLFALSRELDGHDRVALGAVLRAMNDYYGTPGGTASLGSEVKALRAALPLLLETRSLFPKVQGSEIEILSKADALRLFGLTKEQWLRNVRDAVATGGATQTYRHPSPMVGMAMTTPEGDLLTVNLDYSKGDSRPVFIQVIVGYRPDRAARFTDQMVLDAIAAAQRQMAPEFEVHGNSERIEGGLGIFFAILDRREAVVLAQDVT